MVNINSAMLVYHKAILLQRTVYFMFINIMYTYIISSMQNNIEFNFTLIQNYQFWCY